MVAAESLQPAAISFCGWLRKNLVQNFGMRRRRSAERYCPGLYPGGLHRVFSAMLQIRSLMARDQFNHTGPEPRWRIQIF